MKYKSTPKDIYNHILNYLPVRKKCFLFKRTNTIIKQQNYLFLETIQRETIL